MRICVWLVALAVMGAGCAEGPSVEPPTPATAEASPPTTTPGTTAAPASTTTTTTSIATTTTTTVSPFARPEWLGTRPLPLRPDEHGEIQPTPPELADRRLETPDVLEPPAGKTFEYTISSVPEDVAARSSWAPECPVELRELAYVTVSHWGFDGRFHTGELMVNAAVAEDMVEVFRRLHEARFPIEQMRVITAEEIDAAPTGDWNDTTSFVCRPAVGSNSWSRHAYGLAIDINPFHNPYERGDLVLPELASVYTDRSEARPGMVFAGDVVTEAFADIGWIWGGTWQNSKDWMHFSNTGG